MRGPWRGRLPLLVLVLVVVGGASLFAAAGSEGTLSYYRTPSELVGSASSGTVRLGGLVVDGSVRESGGTVRFALTDGETRLDVVVDSVPPSTFRAGQGAVVAGRLGSDGVFHGQSVVVRHDNQYQPSEMLSR